MADKKPVNGKWNEFGEKRSSWYGALYGYALGKRDSAVIRAYGLDEDDKAYIAEVEKHVKDCEAKGIVPQFAHPFEG